MSIKLNLNIGRLDALLSKTKAGAADVTEAARSGMAVVSGTANDLIAYAKLRRVISDLKEEIDLQLRSIGELVYATHCGTPSGSDEMQKILEYVDSLYEEMEGHEREMKLLLGARFCAACGCENSAANVYCQDCGHPLPTTTTHQA